MANILDYLIPDTMKHVRNVQRWENARELQDEIKNKQAALETLAPLPAITPSDPNFEL